MLLIKQLPFHNHFSFLPLLLINFIRHSTIYNRMAAVKQINRHTTQHEKQNKEHTDDTSKGDTT